MESIKSFFIDGYSMARNPIIPVDIDEPASRVLNVLFTLMGKFPGSYFIPFFGAYIEGDDFRGRQTSILLLLHQKGQCTMSEIAKLMKLPASTASKVADPLVQKEFVNRNNGAKDRRIVYLTLTDKGKAEVYRLFQRISFGVDALLDVISDEEKDVLITILEKIGTEFQYPTGARRLFGTQKPAPQQKKRARQAREKETTPESTLPEQ